MFKRVLSRLSYQKSLEWILAHPLGVIIATVVVTLIFAAQLPRLSFETSVYDLQIEDLEETVRYGEFKDLFGSDEIIRVVVKAADVFDAATFGKIAEISETLSEIEGVRRVISLPGIKAAVDMAGTWDMDKFYGVVSRVALFEKNIFSADRKTTALTLVLQTDADMETVIRGVEDVIAGADDTVSLYQIGMPLVSQALARLTETDFLHLPPLTFLIIGIVLLIIFRRPLYLFIPIACIGMALVWTFGLMALIRIPLSMLTMIVPVFLIAVGTAYCLHIVSEYIDRAGETASPLEASRATFSYIHFPTILAVVTTIIGLASLLLNRIPTIREFAVFACFGMFSILIISLSFLPAVLSRVRPPEQKTGTGPAARKLFQPVIEKIIHWNLDRQRVVLPVIAVVFVFCVFGVFRIRVETNPVGYFKADTPVKQNFDDIYRVLSGSFPVNVVMAAGQADYFENPQNLESLVRLQQFLETLPGVDKTISFADYMKLVNYALNRFDPQYYVLPEEGFEVRMAMNNYTTMLGQDMFDRFMSADLSQTNVVLLTHISSSRRFLDLRRQIREHVAQNFSNDLNWEITGFGISISASSHQLTRGQVKSLAVTMVLVFGIMFGLFLSPKVGLIAIVPNIFPIVINFGIMGWLGIELSMVTSLIASIAIGLAVDDTIHYLVRYNKEFQKDLDDRRSLRDTLLHVGRPIIFTTVTISLGFAVLIFSGFKPTAVFGIMMVITMLAALVGDLILLPSLMQHVELVTLWDLVRLKLGQDPGKGIPLFNGMSNTEVHYLIMAGSLKKIDTGHVLFHKGEASDSMYTLISGTMDVVDPVTDQDAACAYGNQRIVNRLITGDVLGEMGLVRSAPRSATVVAREPVELLQVNWKMIQRLQWLYPPIAHKFMHNLLTIICDRLERLTDCLADAKVFDDSTGLCNRENFLRHAETEIRRSRRYGTTMSLCLVEFDMGSENPGLDSQQKETVLRAVSDFFIHNVRNCDILGRCDLHRFGIIAPQTPAHQAWSICNRLRQLLLNRRWTDDGIRLKVFCGVSEINPDSEEDAAGLLAQAGASLEQAKLEC